jgi:ketosteroid isomerase-like protein
LDRLYAAGIFADFGTIAARACGTRAFIGATARTAATTAHLSAAVQIPAIKRVDESSAEGRDSIMKRQVIICGVLLVTAISTCFAAATPAKKTKTAQNGTAIARLEKIIAEAFKNKQVETVKKYLAPEFVGLDAEGFKNVDTELADVPKYDVRDNALADMKVTFPSGNTAVVTYKVTTQASHNGQDISGTYNVASVWTKREHKWRLVVHTFMKSQ